MFENPKRLAAALVLIATASDALSEDCGALLGNE